MNVSPLVWGVTLGLTVAVLLFDIVVVGRRPHEPSRREVGVALGIYLALAVVFGIGVWVAAGATYGTQFFAGWLTEYSLSVDNLFVFLILFARLQVPRQYQQAALLIGIVLALVFRGVFIAVGAAAIAAFSWVFYIFGAFLVFTAVKLVTGHQDDDEEDQEDSRATRWMKTHLPVTEDWQGTRMLARVGGQRVLTPMMLVVVALGTTDLLFALDSIPAIYGLTQEPYLVLTANVFALMGLRQLYFLLGGLLRRLVYLSYGLAVLLAFIGVKLVLHALHTNELAFINGGHHVGWAPDIPIWLSMTVIVVILLVTTVASLLRSRLTESGDRARASAG